MVRVVLIHSPLMKLECYYICYKGFLECWPNRCFKCFSKKIIIFFIYKFSSSLRIWQGPGTLRCLTDSLEEREGEQHRAPRRCLLPSFQKLSTSALLSCDNRKQSYLPQDSSTTRTPSSTWIPVSCPTSTALNNASLLRVTIASPVRRTLMPCFRDLESLEKLVL